MLSKRKEALTSRTEPSGWKPVCPALKKYEYEEQHLHHQNHHNHHHLHHHHHHYRQYKGQDKASITPSPHQERPKKQCRGNCMILSQRHNSTRNTARMDGS
ncbi:hypothetical protein E2C01_039622 [Portunus trituberculatus]|uniref:Uncharacterized protein n=1 Tax=Portunus trituberculatus TaxID=210409 RepID=A0A5B7FKA1_PORTR|nr:hypothetical protein [Portunus trituberculatus]